jgi:hypothetical protein
MKPLLHSYKEDSITRKRNSFYSPASGLKENAREKKCVCCCGAGGQTFRVKVQEQELELALT